MKVRSEYTRPFFGSFREWLALSFRERGTLYSARYVDTEIAALRERISWRLKVLPDAPSVPRFLPSTSCASWADLDFSDGMTLDEIGAELGVSRERVRQIEAKALEKMRRAAELAALSATHGTQVAPGEWLLEMF